MKEPQTGRKFVLRKPYQYRGKLIFLTPRDYLQIDEMEINGKKADPLSIAEEKFC